MKNILFTILSFVIVSTSWAQRPEQKEITVSGKVIDKDSKEPLEYATVAFFSKRQNKMVTGGISDGNGNFSIPVPSGVYDITIEYISFKTESIPDKRLGQNTNLGTISLALDIEALDAVEIIAERTTVEIKLDKKYTMSEKT